MKNLQLQDITIDFGARRCLDRVSLNLLYGRRIALSGANGSGKSTLMKIAAGLLSPDSGEIVGSREARVSYLPQGNVACGPGSLFAEAEKAFRPQEAWLQECTRLEEEISALPPGDPRLSALLHRHHDLQERLSAGGYFSREAAISRVLSGLGFQPQEFDKRAAEFSLGWQMRLALAKVLLENPDFLLLDEPTNYLDLEARGWLLDFFLSFPGGILIVSHDRFFLDATVSAVVELFLGRLRLYKGNYSAYERVRTLEMETLLREARQVEEERERLETFIRRFRAQASRASLVQSRIKQLEKLPVIDIPPAVKKISFTFPDPPAAGRRLLTAEGLTKRYGDKTVFSGVGFEIARGEKVALVGPNGAGKSTLLRLLAGREAADQGRLIFDDRTQIGFFTADEAPETPCDRTVLEALEEVAPPDLVPHLRSLLGAFLFRGDDAFKSVRVLSGGERCRLLLLTLLLKPQNVLVLDEPTSHLDIASQDVLGDALRRFPGTVFFVSHDRKFIEGLAEKVIEMDGGRAVVYNGDYAYYLWKKEEAAARARTDNASPDRKPALEAPSAGRESHEKAKGLRNALKKVDREETALLERLDALQAEQREWEASLAEESNYRDGERVRRIKERLHVLAGEENLAFSRWQELERKRKELEAGTEDAD